MNVRNLVFAAVCGLLSISLAAAAAPLQLQSRGPAAAARPAAPAPAPAVAPTLDPAAVVQKANAYFNNATTMIADFVQLAGNGNRTQGTLYVAKPGRLLFQYAPPATLKIVADGTKLAILDARLHTNDQYFIKQTPLKFLLQSNIDLARDTKVLEATSDANSATVLIADGSTFGGTSRIRLVFDPTVTTLKQWTVLDPQGNETLVTLSNISLNLPPNPDLFVIDH